MKVYEPLLLLGKERWSKVDIRIRVRGGGFTGQIYAMRQAIAKGIVAYYQKYIDEASKKEIKDILMAYDRPLPRVSWHTTRSTSTKLPKKRSRTSSWHMTGRSLSPIHGAASRRNLAVVQHALASRSRTVETAMCIRTRICPRS